MNDQRIRHKGEPVDQICPYPQTLLILIIHFNTLSIMAKKVVTPATTSKEVAVTKFTRIQAVGVIMKANPEATKEVVCNKADTLYIKHNPGSTSNIKETNTQYDKAKTFLLGYNAK
jgi:hypothetical protein